MTRRAVLARPRRHCSFTSVLSPQGSGSHRGGGVHGGRRFRRGRAADAERPDRVLQAAGLRAGA